MAIAFFIVVGLLIPLVFFFVAVAILIGIEWCFHRSTHFSIRDLLIATTLLAILITAAGYLFRQIR